MCHPTVVGKTAVGKRSRIMWARRKNGERGDVDEIPTTLKPTMWSHGEDPTIIPVSSSHDWCPDVGM
jgi:hypothetical protein